MAKGAVQRKKKKARSDSKERFKLKMSGKLETPRKSKPYKNLIDRPTSSR